MAKKIELSADELIKESQRYLRSLKEKICRRCKNPGRLYQSGFCKECYLEIDKERQEKRKETKLKDAKGYIRVYDDDGKLVLEHRLVMEKHLGRKLKKEEVIIWRDGNRSNNDLSNLMIGFKNGTPLEHLRCNHCDTRGDFTYEP